jgi:hypothetical protein
MNTASCPEVLARLRAEYLEMPGMQLTVAQVQRLCGVERTICQWALESLVATKFLWVKDGAYARSTDDEVSRPRAAKAELVTHRRIATAS